MVSHHAGRGAFPKRKDGKFDLDEAKRALDKIKNKGGNGNGNGKDSKPTLWVEQARLAGHNADIKAMESRKMAGELVEVDLVLNEFGKFMFAVRQRLLGMGSRLAPQLAKKTAAYIKREIDGAVDEALDEFAKYNATTGECRPPKPARKNRKSRAKDKAKGKAHRKRVGK